MAGKNYKNIIVEIFNNHIALVTINRPALLNAVDSATIAELKEALLKIENDPDVRVLVITGSGGKAFVVGADLKEMKSFEGQPEKERAFEESGRQVLNLIYDLGKPSVCAINGHALGLGLQMALACTFRIASPTAKFGLPEIKMGFMPSMGATQRLTRLVGEAKAHEMVLIGDAIDAAEALRIGLVNTVVPEGKLSAFVDRFAERLAEKDTAVMKAAMAAIKKEKTMSMQDGLKYEAELSDLLKKRGQ